VFRYSTASKSRSLFFSRDIRTLRELYPEREILQDISDDARLIVSEPVGDLPGAWIEAAESSWGVAGSGDARVQPFAPKAPTTAAAVPA
jgi:glutamine amidotransferase